MSSCYFSASCLLPLVNAAAVCAQAPAAVPPKSTAATSATLKRPAHASTVMAQMASTQPAVRTWPQPCDIMQDCEHESMALRNFSPVLVYPSTATSMTVEVLGHTLSACVSLPTADRRSFWTSLTRQCSWPSGPLGSSRFCNGACCSGACVVDFSSASASSNTSICCASFTPCVYPPSYHPVTIDRMAPTSAVAIPG